MSDLLEPFRVRRAFPQQKMLGELFELYSNLRYSHPGPHARYGEGFVKGVKNVVRLATTGDFHPFIIKRNRAALGLATIISNVHLVNPTRSVDLRGTEVDFWALHNYECDNSFRSDVAEELLERAQKQHARDLDAASTIYATGSLIGGGGIELANTARTQAETTERQDRGQIIGLVPTARAENSELSQLMTAYDNPTTISTAGPDRFGIGTGEQLVQVYVALPSGISS